MKKKSTSTHHNYIGRHREGKSKYMENLEKAANPRSRQEEAVDEIFDVDEDVGDGEEMGVIDRIFDLFSSDDDGYSDDDESYIEE
jgi:hypothetical protein